MLRNSKLPAHWLVGAGTVLGAAFLPLTANAQFSLQILHASDLESGLFAPNFAAVVQGLENDAAADGIPSILLSSGDNYIPSPTFEAAGDASMAAAYRVAYQELFGNAGLTGITEGPGRLDITIMNILGFDASAVGNHEFDSGTATFAGLISSDISGATLADVNWTGAEFPYLSANLDFSGDANLAPLFTSDILPATDFRSDLADLVATGSLSKIAPATIIERDGELIGVIGATTQIVETISSTGDVEVIGDDENDMVELAGILQPVVDQLEGMGVNKIILVSHLQQFALEQELATELDGVDIILAGGSDTILADGNDILRPGDEAGFVYPFQTTDASGDPVMIVSTNGVYTYVGRLVVEFDNSGVLVPASLDTAVNGAYATTDQIVTQIWGSLNAAFANGTKGAQVSQLTDALEGVLAALYGDVIGETTVYLDGRRESVRTQETNLGNLTADANLWFAKQTDSTIVASIKNGGGIRAAIGEIDPITDALLPTQAIESADKEEGEISLFEAQRTLAFNNSLSALTLTRSGLVEVLEYAVSAVAPGATPGSFPQVGGMRFAFDPALPVGERMLSLAIIDEDGNTLDVILKDGIIQGNANGTVRIVTLGFLAEGGDGYPFPALASNIVALGGAEQEALVDYLGEFYPVDGDTVFEDAELPISQDARIQNNEYRSDTAAYPAAAPTNAPQLAVVGTYRTGLFDEAAAEITAFDADNDRIYLVNANDGSVDILDAANAENLVQSGHIDINALFGGNGVVAEPNSVAYRNNVIAVAIARNRESDDRPLPGYVGFFDPSGNELARTEVGYLPDMVTFTPNGHFVLTANEGEPMSDFSFDPEGSVSIIPVSFLTSRAIVASPYDRILKRLRPAQRAAIAKRFIRLFQRRSPAPRARHLFFTNVPSDVRTFGPSANSPIRDIEPEYIAISPNSSMAYVSLQENNAIAAIDIYRNRIVSINSLGLKDMSVAGFDASNRDNAINITNWPVYGMYMPDAIACYTVGNQTYIVTANEGDARDYDAFSEEARVKDLDLDPTAFPNAAELQEDELLGRLTVTTTEGDTDGDGDYDQIVAFGGRSFSIFRVTGGGTGLTLVYDSGADFEKITASLQPEFFNASNDESEFDARSDDKGPEPEGVTLGVVGGKTYAFICLERVGGIMVYDVSTPAAPIFVQYINNRDFLADPESPEAGDLGPESATFVSAAQSPNGVPMLIVANEISGTVTAYSFE
ncbi:MAG: choice-of-anchor I family protein [Puniceicoccales bacterium]